MAPNPSTETAGAGFFKEREEREEKDRRTGRIVWSWLLSLESEEVRDPSTEDAAAGFFLLRLEQCGSGVALLQERGRGKEVWKNG